MFTKFRKILIYGLVFAVLLQTSFALSLLNPQKAQAASENITQINFTTIPQSILENTISAKFTVQTQNSANDPEPLSATTHLHLQSNSPAGTGEFSSSSTEWEATSTLTMSNGSANRSFYYKNSTPGTYIITVTADSENWTAATQTVVITTPDITAPVINLIGDNPQIIEKGTVYTELGATANDEVDGDISTNIVIDSTNVDTNTTGTYQVTYNVSDAAGNSADQITRVINVVDTTKPIGTFNINNGSTVTNNIIVNLYFSSISSDVKTINISNDGTNFQPYDWNLGVLSLPWTLNNDKGDKTVYVTFTDQTGNTSEPTSAHIYFDPNTTNIDTIIINPIDSGTDISSENSPELSLTFPEILGTAALTTASYTQNPGVNLPTGITAFGKYYEVALNDKNFVSWPITIKIYYTQADLDQAGISENKLVGLYYFDQDTNSWKLFENTGVNTNDIENTNYVGYIWANITHLTPISAGYDIAAPQKPANFTANGKDGAIDLSWEKVTDATGYYVRYREGTNIDNRTYQTIFLSGADSVNTKATGLKNGTLYEFGIKSIDKYGNESEWAVVIATPVTEATLAVAETTVLTSAPQTAISTTTPSTVDEGKSAEIVTVNSDNGQVKSEEMKTSTRFWITLLILVIAAGAAYGGYYAYQWWMTRPKKEKTKVKKTVTPTAPKSPEKGGRW